MSNQCPQGDTHLIKTCSCFVNSHAICSIQESPKYIIIMHFASYSPNTCTFILLKTKTKQSKVITSSEQVILNCFWLLFCAFNGVLLLPLLRASFTCSSVGYYCYGEGLQSSARESFLLMTYKCMSASLIEKHYVSQLLSIFSHYK